MCFDGAGGFTKFMSDHGDGNNDGGTYERDGRTSIRTAIVDDHPVVRAGVRLILEEDARVDVVIQESNGDRLFAALERTPADIVVLDVGLPGRSGIEVLKDLNQRFPEIPVIVLSMHQEEMYGLRSIRAGAAGYVSKDQAPEQLIDAMNVALSGGIYLTPGLSDRLAAAYRGSGSSKSGHEQLSDREMEVISHIGAGHASAEIAEKLNLSINTVNTYRRRIMQKLGLQNTAAIVRFALEHSL